MALLDGGAVRQGGIVQNRINVIFSIGCQNDVIGVPIQDLLIGNFGPVGIFHAGGGVCAVGVFDHRVLIHGGACGFQHGAVACQVNAGGIGAGNGFGQGGQVAVNGHFQLLAAGGGVGCLCQQLDRAEQAGLVFRLNSQHGQAHFLHLGDGILELGGHDDKIRGQRSAAFQVKLFGGANAGQGLDLRGGQAVDVAFVGFGFHANQLVLHAQRNQQAGGNVVAAGKGFGFFLNGNFAAQLVGNGQRVGNRRFGGRFFRCSSGFRGCGSLYGSSLAGCGTAGSSGAAAGCQCHSGGQQQGDHFGHFHVSYFLLKPIFRCVFQITTEL